MTGGTFATADYPRLQQMVNNAPAGSNDREDWVVEGWVPRDRLRRSPDRPSQRGSIGRGRNLGNPDRRGTR